MSEEAALMKQAAEQMQVNAEKMKEKAAKMRQDMKHDAEMDAKNDVANTGTLVQGREQQQEEGGDRRGYRSRDDSWKSKTNDAETYFTMAKRQYKNRVKGFSQKEHKCQRCWLIKECCVCDKITPVSTKHECILPSPRIPISSLVLTFHATLILLLT